ncbi:Ribokinase-like protein [Elaphomyces granulatus]
MAPLIRVIGSLNVDVVSVTPRFPGPGETITTTSFMVSAGGKGANQAVACGRLSRPRLSPATGSSTSSTGEIRVEMVGAVGGQDGHFQALLRPTLQSSGLDTSRIQIVEDAYTGVAVIVVDSSAGGENRILVSPGANYTGMQPIPPVLETGLAAPTPDIIVMQAEIPVETVIGILRRIQAFKAESRRVGRRGIDAGPEVIFNPAPAPPGGLPEDVYATIDHLIMNETEAALMIAQTDKMLQLMPEADEKDYREQVARCFHRLGVSFVVITLGAKGVWYSATDIDGNPSGPVDGANRFTDEIPAARVDQVVDTTAAGDTFVGGYAVHVARWREQRRLQGQAGEDLTDDERQDRYQRVMAEAMQYAIRASARCVERLGAMDSIPWEDEI